MCGMVEDGVSRGGFVGIFFRGLRGYCNERWGKVGMSMVSRLRFLVFLNADNIL